jgi:hypothetical protein
MDDAIDIAQQADETRLVQRLCLVKNRYEGKTQQQAGAAVAVFQPTSSRWAHAWNKIYRRLRPTLRLAATEASHNTVGQDLRTFWRWPTVDFTRNPCIH